MATLQTCEFRAGADRRGDEADHCRRLLTCKWLLAYCAAVADVFRALADPTRRKILDELSERNSQTLFEICSRLATKHRLGSSRQAISQHLDVLEHAGLIKSQRRGRCKFHEIDTTPLERIADRWLQTAREEAECVST
jgi:DNA-binding transcriptional ArsR family regulator